MDKNNQGGSLWIRCMAKCALWGIYSMEMSREGTYQPVPQFAGIHTLENCLPYWNNAGTGDGVSSLSGRMGSEDPSLASVRLPLCWCMICLVALFIRFVEMVENTHYFNRLERKYVDLTRNSLISIICRWPR